MTYFKHLAQLVDREMEYFTPTESTLYDGYLFEGKHYPVKMYPEQFKCVRCGQSTGYAFISCEGTQWLTCSDRVCMRIDWKKGLRRDEKMNMREGESRRFATLSDIGIEPEFHNASLAACQQKAEFIEKMGSFSKVPSGFFVIAGDQGRGKTYAACAMSDAIMAKGVQVRYFFFPMLVHRYNLVCSEKGKMLSFLESLQEVPVLFLDDFGTKDAPTDSLGEFLFALIHHRKTDPQLGTIITTGKSSIALEKTYGSAMMSRVTAGTCLKFEGEDRRKKKF